MAVYIFVPTGGKVESDTPLTEPLFVAAKAEQAKPKAAPKPKAAKTTRARKAE